MKVTTFTIEDPNGQIQLVIGTDGAGYPIILNAFKQVGTAPIHDRILNRVTTFNKIEVDEYVDFGEVAK